MYAISLVIHVSMQVQCYACKEAETCTHLDMCVSNARIKSTFHCESPLAGLEDVDVSQCSRKNMEFNNINSIPFLVRMLSVFLIITLGSSHLLWVS